MRFLSEPNDIYHYFQPHSRTIKGIGKTTIRPTENVDVNLKLNNTNSIKNSFHVTQESRNYGIIALDISKINSLIISPHTSEFYQSMSDCTAKLYKIQCARN